MFNRNAIIKALEAKGWSKYKLCKEAHMAQSTLSTILSGKAENPNTKTLQKIADALNVPVNDFFDGGNDKVNGLIENTNKIDDKDRKLAYMQAVLDFAEPEDALKFILSQPALMDFGGYDLKKMSDQEILDLAQDMLLAMRISLQKIERNKK